MPSLALCIRKAADQLSAQDKQFLKEEISRGSKEIEAIDALE